MRPEARTEGLIVEKLPTETLVYDERTQKAHCLNSTAAAVWRHCDGRTTMSEIAILVHADNEVVWLALTQLEKAKLIEKFQRPASAGVLSRRDAARRLAFTAIGLPAILSIVAPRPANAASCLPSCSQCTTNAQCCSGHCNNTSVLGCQPVPGHQCT